MRISSNPKPSNNDIDWKVAWSREEDPAVTAGFVDGVASRIFSPSLLRSGLDVAAIEITLYHLDRTDNFTSPYLFISGALTLLFLLSLAMMHLLARQGSLIIIRSVIKIRPEPIADAA